MTLSPKPFDVAIYARDMATHLAAMAEAAGFAKLGMLFRAAALEAADAAFAAQGQVRPDSEAPEDAA